MSKASNIIVKLDPATPTLAYDTFWKFAFERQNIFIRRSGGEGEPFTNDEILKKYKFTNVFRACDRVSQYLISEIIYSKKDYSLDDVIFRILLFKLFNKIETWELLKERFGDITIENFSVSSYRSFLDREMNHGRVLYSNAYMMASGCSEFNVTRKHHSHLLLLRKMLKTNLPSKLLDCKKMRDAYSLLLSYPLIGKFLAYQYVTDINYSEAVDYSETEFTIPGPGARDGIRKCFSSLGGLSETDIIKLMTDRQDIEFDRLDLNFKKLGKRSLQYIDIQNIFCEVDKYSRIAHPEIKGISGRTRIKQTFKPNNNPIKLCFPPKWNVKLRGVINGY